MVGIAIRNTADLMELLFGVLAVLSAQNYSQATAEKRSTGRAGFYPALSSSSWRSQDTGPPCTEFLPEFGMEAAAFTNNLRGSEQVPTLTTQTERVCSWTPPSRMTCFKIFYYSSHRLIFGVSGLRHSFKTFSEGGKDGKMKEWRRSETQRFYIIYMI